MRSGRYVVTLLIGAPGAGKGTQARVMSEALGVPHIATGDLLREHRRRGTPLGRTAKAYMDRGDLVPNDLVVQMVIERLGRPDAANGALLDGFPRTLDQARSLDRELAARSGGVRLALLLEVPTATLVDRLAGRRICIGCQGTFHVALQQLPADGSCPECGDRLAQRPDDATDVVRHRVRVFLHDTAPVIEYYRAQGLVRDVDGARPVEQIRPDILAALGKASPAPSTAPSPAPSPTPSASPPTSPASPAPPPTTADDAGAMASRRVPTLARPGRHP